MVLELLIGRPGTTEILILVLVIVLLFGASKVPQLARSLGRAKGEFQKGMEEGEEEAKAAKKKRAAAAEEAGDEQEEEEEDEDEPSGTRAA